MSETQEQFRPLSISEALAICLEHARHGREYGVRPVGFKGIVYGWQSQDGADWELCQTDSGTEPHDDTIILGEFEVLKASDIKRDWPT